MLQNDPQTWIKVEVPAIIEVNRHVKCCCRDGRITAISSRQRRKSHRYYVCQFPRVERHQCLTYRAELVDEIVGVWISRLLPDPEALHQGLEAYRQEDAAGPISMHASAIISILVEKRAALQRLLDLYLSGELDKDMLIDKKMELEKAIGELERERSALLAGLRARSISEEPKEQIVEFAPHTAEGLQAVEADIQERRRMIETLAVEVTLYPEDGVKKVQFGCSLGAGVSALSPIAFKELAL